MNTRLAAALFMLRKASARAMTVLLNQYAQQYSNPKATPQDKAKAVQAIMSAPAIWSEMRGLMQQKLSNKYPTLRAEDVEDITAEGLTDFLRGKGVERSLALYNPNHRGENGPMSFAWWLFGRFQQYTQKRAERFFQEAKSGVSKRPGETLLPGAMPSLDAPIQGNPKYQSDASDGMDMPNLGSYRSNPDQITQYHQMLERIEEALEQLSQSPKRQTSQGAAQIAELREMQEEIVARLKETDRAYQQWNGPQPAPAGYSDRADRIIPDLPTSNKMLVDTSKLNHTLRSYGEQYDRLPEFIESIMDPRANTGGKGKAPHSDASRWYFPGTVYNESASLGTDETMQKKIRQAMISAFSDAHMLLNSKDFHRKRVLDSDEFGFGDLKITGRDLKKWLPVLARKHMTRLGVPPEIQTGVLQQLEGRDLRSLQMMVNDGDEMRRLHTYDRLRSEMGIEDWSSMTPEQREAIVENSYGAMGYGPENRPFARNPKTTGLLSAQGTADYDPNAMRAYMMEEMRGFGSPRFRAQMPQNAQFFNSRSKSRVAPQGEDEFQLAPDPITAAGKELAQRIAYRIAFRTLAEQTTRIATELERNGLVRAADSLDNMIRTAASVLG